MTRFGPHDPPSAKAGKSAGDEIESLALSPDARIVATPHGGFELPAFKRVRGWPKLGSVAFSPDGALFAGLDANALEVRDGTSGAALARAEGGDDRFGALAFSPDGARIAVGAYMAVLVFYARTAEQLARFTAFDRVVKRVAWSPDGTMIAVQSYDDVGLFDAARGKPIAGLAGIESDRNLRGQGALVFLHDGRLIATIDASSVGVWSAGEGGAPARTIPQRGFTYAVAAHRELVAIGNSLDLELYTPDFDAIETLEMPGGLFSLAIANDGNLIVGGGYQNVLAWRRGGGPVKPAAPTSTRIAKPHKPKTTDLEAIDWLGKVGDVSKWPGPDDPGVAALLDLIQTLEDDVDVALRALGKPRDRARDRRTYEKTFTRAAKKLRRYDPKADWSDPSTAAPTMVASIAQLVASYRDIGWPLSRDLETLLAACADGAWPCRLDAKRALVVL